MADFAAHVIQPSAYAIPPQTGRDIPSCKKRRDTGFVTIHDGAAQFSSVNSKRQYDCSKDHPAIPVIEETPDEEPENETETEEPEPVSAAEKADKPDRTRRSDASDGKSDGWWNPDRATRERTSG